MSDERDADAILNSLFFQDSFGVQEVCCPSL